MKTLLGVIVVVALLLAAAIYFFHSIGTGMQNISIQAQNERVRQMGTDPKLIMEALRRRAMTTGTAEHGRH